MRRPRLMLSSPGRCGARFVPRRGSVARAIRRPPAKSSFRKRLRRVVIGQSAGGWGTIAYDSLAHPKVAAFIVMAGGRGGHMHDEPHRNCHPERLVRAAGQYGKTASTPMLWVYSQNDTFFDPSIARALYQSFTASGGRATFEQPGPFGTDGHHLFFGRGGSVIWGPLVESYLASGSISAHN